MSDPASILRIGSPESAEECEAYYALRWHILRAPWGQPRGSERDDREEKADHVGAWDAEGRLVGIGRLHLNSPSQAQIRYMAVEENHRGSGVGRAIHSRLEQLARGHGVEHMVLHARETAVGFYQALGYRVTGPAATMFGTVVHFSMEKRLPGE